MKSNLRKTIIAAMFIAIGIVLPIYTGQIPAIGKMLQPMHLPILLCGLICGWQYGLAAGAILPLLRSLLFSMPPMYPQAVIYAFEIATYGLLAGLLYKLFKKHNVLTIYASLIGAMLGGRIVYGIVSYLIKGPLMGGTFTFEMFLAGAFVEAWPGIVAQLIIIPAIMLVLKKAKLTK